MKINIQEQPKPKSFFESEIVKRKTDISRIPRFYWSTNNGILSATLLIVFVIAYLTYPYTQFVSIFITFIGFLLCLVFLKDLYINGKNIKLSFEMEINSLSESVPESCLKIEEYLSNELIKSFVNQVVTLESRKLRNCEVDAMKVLFEQNLLDKYAAGRQSRIDKKAAENQVKIDAACERVYIEPLVNPT